MLKSSQQYYSQNQRYNPASSQNSIPVYQILKNEKRVNDEDMMSNTSRSNRKNPNRSSSIDINSILENEKRKIVLEDY